MSAQLQSSSADAQRFDHQYVRIDGQRIHCVTAGAGTPVLLIPGWPQTGMPGVM